MMEFRLTTAAAAALAAGLAIAPISASAQEKVLRIGAQADAGTLDPQAQNVQTTLSLLSMMYEALVTRDKSLAKAPQLATSWEVIEPTVWRFKLREGVKFHDGADFGADDVAFTIQRAKAATSQFTSFVSSIKDVKIVDDTTVDIVTERPDPLLADKLTSIFMVDKGWAETNGVTEPQNFKDSQETYSVLNANGTGPYSLQSREPDSKTVLVRNKDYWGKTDGDIDQIVFSPLSNDPTRIAALLSGELDLVIDVPSQDVAKLATNPEIKLEQTNEFRTLFFGFDLKSDSLKYGDAGGKNPFLDVRVRRAINSAIDADSVVKAVMRGYATPTGQILAPGNTGYDAALDARTPYDPEAAKKMLAEAGYPDGFSVTLDCPNNRYINDEQICKAVTTMLTQVGIKVSLNAIPRATFFPKLFERDTSMFLMGFNSPYFDGMYALETLLMSRNDAAGEGIYNYENHSNPDLDKRIAAARDETDLEKRAEMMKGIYKTITEDAVLVPLHHQVLVYAMRKNVDAVVRPDNWLEIRWVTMN